MVNKISDISLATKIIKKIRLLCILFPKVSTYRIGFDENECVCLTIKEDKWLMKVVDKYMDISKVENTTKKANNIYSKKYSKKISVS